jgi:hypothetical protein
MKLVRGKQYRVKWLDAFGDASWTDEEALGKLIEWFSKPVDQTLYFIKQTPDFYIFTSAKPEEGKPLADVHGIPRGWIDDIKAIR